MDIGFGDLVLISQARPSAVVDIAELHAEAEEASQSLEAARRTLTEAEEEVAEVRRRQREIRSDQEDLRVLAEVALRHLGPNCPVCQQIHDVESTRERLESVLIPISRNRTINHSM